MIESFNAILFSLTTLFGVMCPIYSDYTEVKVDIDAKTIDIVYSELQTFRDYEGNLSQIIGCLDSLKTIDTNFSDLSLIANSYQNRDGEIDYQIRLKYKTTQALKDFYKIDLDSSKIFVHILETISVNSIDSLSTESDFGEYLSFSKSMNRQYVFRFNWEYEKIPLEMITLTRKE